MSSRRSALDDLRLRHRRRRLVGLRARAPALRQPRCHGRADRGGWCGRPSRTSPTRSSTSSCGGRTSTGSTSRCRRRSWAVACSRCRAVAFSAARAASTGWSTCAARRATSTAGRRVGAPAGTGRRCGRPTRTWKRLLRPAVLGDNNPLSEILIEAAVEVGLPRSARRSTRERSTASAGIARTSPTDGGTARTRRSSRPSRAAPT